MIYLYIMLGFMSIDVQIKIFLFIGTIRGTFKFIYLHFHEGMCAYASIFFAVLIFVGRIKKKRGKKMLDSLIYIKEG